LVIQGNDADPSILRSILCQHLRGRVGAAIVKDEELEISKGLVQDAVDGLPEMGFAIPYGHDDGDERWSHGMDFLTENYANLRDWERFFTGGNRGTGAPRFGS